MTVETFAALADRIRARPPRLGGTRLVAVDGPSGAGKTLFAGQLAAALGGAPVVHTDELLDGWSDQLTFWPRLEEKVLRPLRAGRTASYQRYGWDRQRFGGPPERVPPGPVVLLEGMSAARAAVRPELSLAVFVTAPADVRLRRQLLRDGAHLQPFLEEWGRVETAHFAADRTAAHADLVVDGAARTPHDAARQYVRLVRDDERS